MKPSQNPFRSSALSRLRYCIGEHEVSSLLAKAQALGYRASIKGPHGTGKSTLLEDMANSLRDKGLDVNWYYINRQMPKPEKLAVLNAISRSSPDVLNCLDGGEALGFFTWNHLIQSTHRKNIKLLATTHYPCLLPVLFKTKCDFEMMLNLSQRLAKSQWNEPLKRTAISAYNNNSGNVREVFRRCYLHCADKNKAL